MPEIFLDRVAHGSDDSSISVKAQNPNRILFRWPMTAIVLGAFAAVNPFYQPDIAPFIGYAAWLIVIGCATANCLNSSWNILVGMKCISFR